MKSSDNRAREGEHGQRTCHAVDGKARMVDEESNNQSASISQSSWVNVVCWTFWLWWNRLYSYDDGHSVSFQRTYAFTSGFLSLTLSIHLSISLISFLFLSSPAQTNALRRAQEVKPYYFVIHYYRESSLQEKTKRSRIFIKL